MKHVARKRFGQNFLQDASVIEAIVAAIGIDQHDRLLEIGPGLGALTRPLVEALERADNLPLHILELDRDLLARFTESNDPTRIAIHAGDALKFDFGSVLKEGERLRVVGNLPYNISSPLLFHLRTWSARIRDQHFMLQKEVVERMTAQPGESAFGRLSVMLQVSYQMEHLFDVPPEAFHPAPKVTSSIVRMIPDAALSAAILEPGLFEELVAQAFSQRRKMVRNTLAAFAAIVPLEESGIEATARAEDVAPAQYVDYCNRLARYRGAVPVER